MYITEFRKLHPNIIKHAVELVGEKNILPAVVVNKLCKENFSDSDDGCKSCAQFLINEGVSQNKISEVLNAAITLLYSLDNPYLIIAKYVHSNKVRSSVRNAIMKFNNNNNYSFDLDSILNGFEKFISSSPSTKYDFNGNTIVNFIMYNYLSYFEKSTVGKTLILTEINSKGTQVKGADGEISLLDLQSISDEEEKFKIDFPSTVKSIYEGSECLFNISNKVCYDFFSHYMNKEADSLKSEVNSIFKASFGSEDIGPIIVTDSISYNTETDFGRNTIRQRILMLDMVYDTVCNSSDESDIKDLFATVVGMDLATLNSSNIGTLFKHKTGANYDRFNMTLFLKILKGCQALRSFIKYIKINNIRLSKSDYVLFRDPSYYRRFESIQDYLSLKDIIPEVIKEGNDIDDSVSYFTNDECYETINRKCNYNLSSLSSYVKKEINKMMTNTVNIEYFINDINSRYEFCNYLYSYMISVKERCESAEIDPYDPRVFDVYSSGLADFDDYIKMVVFPNDEYLQMAILGKKDIRSIMRYLSLRIAYYSHILKILSICNLDIEDIMLYLDKRLLDFPSSIQDMVTDTAKLITDVPLSYHLAPGVNPSQDIELKKQYYIMSSSISEEHKEIFKFISKWIDDISVSLESYGISLFISKLPKILQEKHVEASFRPRISTNAFELFKSKYTIKHGFLYDRGKLLKYKGFYVHENGYMFLADGGYQMVAIKDNQTFD